jgi:hypothetical protein
MVLRVMVLLAVLAMQACATAPSVETIDTLDYIIGAPETWPRHGLPNHYQHQTVDADRVCWTKYTLPWSYECWRWDSAHIYHAVDHAIDGNRRWEHYIFSDGRWLPRRLVKGEIWSLDLLDNRLTWFDSACNRADERPAPYRVRAWYEGVMDAGGDLGLRDVIILSYQPNPDRAEPNTGEHFYFAKGAGWYRWTRGTREVTFNRLGGVARAPAPLCEKDFQG